MFHSTCIVEAPSVVYSKQYDTYGFCFKSITSAFSLIKTWVAISPMMKRFLAKFKNSSLRLSNGEMVFVPLCMTSETLILVVSESDILDTTMKPFEISDEISFTGSPAVNNGDVGILFESHLQFTFAFSRFFEELGHNNDDDLESSPLSDDTVLFLPISILKNPKPEFSPRVVSRNSCSMIVPSASKMLEQDVNLKSYSTTIQGNPLMTVVKASTRSDNVLDSNGATTVASSLSASSTASSMNSPDSESDSVKIENNHKTKKLPINKPELLATHTISEFKELTPKKYNKFIDVLTNYGWATGEATWAKQWWRIETVYIPPWVAAEKEKKWVLGRDYFWHLEDVAAFLKKSNSFDQHNGAILKRSEMKEDFSDALWNLNRRIKNIVDEGSNIERDRLPEYLEQSGWCILKRGNSKKNIEYLYVPHWSSDLVNWETRVDHVLDQDFFNNMENVMKHIKANGNAPSEHTRKSPILKSAPEVKSSDSDAVIKPNKDLEDKIFSLIKAGNKFKVIWPMLLELGWKNMSCSIKSVLDPPSVYVPSWEKDSTSSGLFPVSRKVHKRDYFLDQDEVMVYLSKHGFKRVNTIPSPDIEFKRSSKAVTYVIDTKDKVDSKELVEKVKEKEKKAKKSKPIVQLRKNDLKVMSPSSESDISSLSSGSSGEYEIKAILRRDPKDIYMFPHLWVVLKNHGWKTAWVDDYQQIYVPPWTNLPVVKSKVNVSGLVLNKDYFEEKQYLVEYLKKYGMHQIEEATKRQELRQPKLELKAILNRDPSKVYIFHDLWVFLRDQGWKSVTTNNPLLNQVYIPSWTTLSTPVKGKFNIRGLTVNVDYFIDPKDIIDYLRQNGLKRVGESASVDEFNDKSPKRALPSDDYQINFIAPKNAIRGRESKDFDPYAAFDSILETQGSPDSNMNEMKIDSYPEISDIKRPDCWLGLSQLQVVEEAIKFQNSDNSRLSLEGRHHEYQIIWEAIENSLKSCSGSCILLHGQPGQGKSHIINMIIQQCIQRNSLPRIQPVDIVYIQGTTITSHNSIFSEIATQLGISGSDSRDNVLNRFQTSAESISSPGTVSDFQPIKKHRKAKSVPMTLLVIEEAYNAKHEDLRAIMEISRQSNSSVIVLGIFNNRSLYDSLQITDSEEGSCIQIDFPVYTASALESLANHYLCGLGDPQALKMLAINCSKNDNSDMRSLIATCSKCLHEYYKTVLESDLGLKTYTGEPLLTFTMIKNTISSLNSVRNALKIKNFSDLDQQSLRLVLAMRVRGTGLDAPASSSDIKASYEDFTKHYFPSEVNHLGDTVERRLEALADQTILLRSGTKAKKLFQMNITYEEIVSALEDKNYSTYKQLVNQAEERRRLEQQQIQS